MSAYGDTHYETSQCGSRKYKCSWNCGLIEQSKWSGNNRCIIVDMVKIPESRHLFNSYESPVSVGFFSVKGKSSGRRTVAVGQ